MKKSVDDAALTQLFEEPQAEVRAKKHTAEHLKQFRFQKGNQVRKGMKPAAAVMRGAITLAMKDILSEPIPDDWKELVERRVGKKGFTFLEAIALSTVIRAVRGDRFARAEVLDRVDGPVTRQINLVDVEGMIRALAESEGLDARTIMQRASKLIGMQQKIEEKNADNDLDVFAEAARDEDPRDE